MSRIRSSNNKTTELRLIALFKDLSFKGWRRNYGAFGKPDFVFLPERVAIFVDGCFWPGCPKCYRPQKTNAEFWTAKINRNKTRDRLVTRELRSKGWRVFRMWECQLKNPTRKLSHLRWLLNQD
jgi:DNA mismatch endonuclease (patch repair protein)